MGAVRTTFSMVAACILRRKQVIERGLQDPFMIRTGSQRSGVSTVSLYTVENRYAMILSVNDSRQEARSVIMCFFIARSHPTKSTGESEGQTQRTPYNARESEQRPPREQIP